MSQDVYVDTLMNSLVFWQEFCLDNSMDIKKSDQHHLGFGLEHPRFFGSWWQCALPLKALLFGEWIILKIHDSLPVTTLFSKMGSVLSCSKMSWHTCTRCSFYPLFCNLGAIFAQIFCNDPPYPLTIYTQLICYHSNSKAAIALHLLSRPLNIFICFAWGWPPTPVIIFHLLFSLFEPPVPLKKTSSWHYVITIVFLKQLECFSWSFSKTDKKFQVDSLFDVHPWHQKKSQKFLILSNFHKTVTKKEKRAKKNVFVTECWNLVFETMRHCDIIERGAFFSAIKVVRAACTTAQSLYFSNTPRIW